jgi:hypothetical protein
VLYELPSQLPEFADNYLDFVTYYLEEPLALSGTFYVGFQQDHSVQLNIGFDQNCDARGKFFYRTAAYWSESIYKGAPMIRPVVGKSFDHSGVASHEQIADIKMYPNPTSDIIHIQINDYQEDIDYRIMNVYGQCLEAGRLNSSELSLSRFANGVYFVQLSSKNRPIITEKIIKK